MRWRTVFVLAVLVIGLAFLVRRRAQDEASGLGAAPVQFLVAPELAPERVASIRVDSVERGIQLRLERDAIGAWFLTDPIAYPAAPSVVDALLRTLDGAQGEAAPETDLEALGLSPPKVVLYVNQAPEDGGGDERTYRVDVGSVDLVSDRVYLLAHDHPSSEDGRPFLLRGTRALYTTLDRNPDDYRETRATHFSGPSVARIERRGEVWLPDRERRVDLDLVAQRDGGRWDRTDGVPVRLDPNAMGLVARAAAELRVRGFEDDSPDSLAAYGLDPPAFSFQLQNNQGDQVSLIFGFPGHQEEGRAWSDIWYCRRVGSDTVWWIEETDVMILVRPADELFDYFLVRAQRESMVRVDLEADGTTRTLEREPGSDAWFVFETSQDDEPGREPARYRAASGAVQDVLAALESIELDYPEGITFEAAPEPRSITLTTEDGARWGGEIGAPWKDRTTGTVGRHFRRFGDRLSGVLAETVADLLLLDLDDLRDARIHRVRAVDVAAVELAYDGRRYSYAHPDGKDWIVRPSGFPAPKAFAALTVHLFSLRARSWLEGEPATVKERVEVKVTSREGEEIDFLLARGDEGELLCRENGAWSVVETASQRDLFEGDLGQELLALFAE